MPSIASSGTLSLPTCPSRPCTLAAAFSYEPPPGYSPATMFEVFADGPDDDALDATDDLLAHGPLLTLAATE